MFSKLDTFFFYIYIYIYRYIYISFDTFRDSRQLIADYQQERVIHSGVGGVNDSRQMGAGDAIEAAAPFLLAGLVFGLR